MADKESHSGRGEEEKDDFEKMQEIRDLCTEFFDNWGILDETKYLSKVRKICKK